MKEMGWIGGKVDILGFKYSPPCPLSLKEREGVDWW